jgi:hypothetical protein
VIAGGGTTIHENSPRAIAIGFLSQLVVTMRAMASAFIGHAIELVEKANAGLEVDLLDRDTARGLLEAFAPGPQVGRFRDRRPFTQARRRIRGRPGHRDIDRQAQQARFGDDDCWRACGLRSSPNLGGRERVILSALRELLIEGERRRERFLLPQHVWFTLGVFDPLASGSSRLPLEQSPSA